MSCKQVLLTVFKRKGCSTEDNDDSTTWTASGFPRCTVRGICGQRIANQHHEGFCLDRQYHYMALASKACTIVDFIGSKQSICHSRDFWWIKHYVETLWRCEESGRLAQARRNFIGSIKGLASQANVVRKWKWVANWSYARSHRRCAKHHQGPRGVNKCSFNRECLVVETVYMDKAYWSWS